MSIRIVHVRELKKPVRVRKPKKTRCLRKNRSSCIQNSARISYGRGRYD